MGTLAACTLKKYLQINGNVCVNFDFGHFGRVLNGLRLAWKWRS
jgi:hypothetical protein